MAAFKLSPITVTPCEMARSAERICADLFGDEAAVQVITTAITPKISNQAGWITVCTGEGVRMQVAIEGEDAPGLRYLRGVRLGAALFRHAASAWISTVPVEFSALGEFACHIREEGESPLRVFLRLGSEAECEITGGFPPRDLPRGVRVPLTLFSRSVPSGFPGIASIGFADSEVGLGYGDGTSTVIRLDEWGGTMTEQQIFQGEFPVQVELGTVELSADELLNLRPGDMISIPSGAEFTGKLRIAGEAWATVRIERGQDEWRLSVTELCVPETTSSRSVR